tara:strand:- start:9562 stop:10002 length:441 start_codon:yes stop_codon:yes gene_type:complete
MTNYLLFNNLRYNKLINKKTIESHPNKDLFINIFILLVFVIGIALFLSYRYNNKINRNKNISQEDVSSEEDNNNNIKENSKNETIEENTENTENIQNIENIKKVKINTENKEQKKYINNNYLNDIQNNNFINNIDTEDEKYSSIIN